MVKCGWTEKRIIVQVLPSPGSIEQVEYANVRYGRSKDVTQKKLTTNVMGKVEFCYVRGLNPYISIQKTNYIFSTRPITKKPDNTSWGASSDWIKVIGPYLTIYSLKKPDLPVIDFKEICESWKTTADPQVPSELVTFFTPSLPISIKNAKWECPNLNISENITGVNALIKINRSTITEIPITNGYSRRVDIGDIPAFSPALESLKSRGSGIIPIEIIIPGKDTSPSLSQEYDVLIPLPKTTIPEIPLPDVKPICELGEQKTATCADGSTIITHVCKTEPVTGLNQWAPTGRPCPTPQMGKTAKILTAPDGKLQAFDGMSVTIAASVMCGATPSNGEAAFLIIDGEQVASKTTSYGFVSFTWKATAEPSRTHRIVVRVPQSTQCPAHGEASDSKTITVSRSSLNIEEQLAQERSDYKEGLALLREERKRIRELSLPTDLTPPITPPITPPVELPITPPVEPPVEPPITPPVELIPGVISIPSIPAPPLTEYPINIFIDDVLKGSPPLNVEVQPGIHYIRVELKNFIPLNKKVTVNEGQTLIITNMEFLT